MTMKYILATILTLALAASATAADRTQLKLTGEGYQVGTTANQAVGFFGATPAVQPSSASQVALTNVFSTVSIAPVKVTNTSAQAALTVGTSADIITNVTISLTTTDIKYLDEGSTPRTNTVVTGATLTLASISGVTNVTINTVHGYTTALPTVVMTDATVSGPYGFASGTIGSNTIAYINAIRSALVTLGLIKGSN